MNNFIKKELPFLIILIIPLIAAFIIYPYMPDLVPSHWNFKGEVDDYSSRAFGSFFIPILNIGMYALFIILPKLDPKSANYKKFTTSYKVMRYSLHIFFIILYALTVLAALEYPIDMGLWITVCISILYIVLGNVMGKVRHNYFVGFKFPWTLANEEVWKKTHQVGAKAMVLGGVVSLIGVIFVDNSFRFIIIFVCIFVPTILVSIYSYVYYRKVTK